MTSDPSSSLTNRVIGGARWLALGRFLGQAVTWITTILVIRLLTPDDYGLLAMATVFIALLALIEEMGLGSALVQMREIDRGVIEKVFGLLILLNLALYGLLLVLAPFFAGFFGEPRVTSLIRVLALQFLLVPLIVIPDSLLRRDLKFRGKSLVEFLSMVGSGLLTLVLAYLGLGVWSLVYGSLFMGLVKVVGLNITARRFFLPSFSVRGMSHVVKFGGLVTVGRVLWFVYTQADVFIIGRLLGKELLGFYSVAKNLAALPLRKVAGILNEVSFSGFSRMQDDPETFSRNFLKSATYLAFFGFPVFFGISAVAPEIVSVLLGEKWSRALIPLQALSLIAPLRLVGTTMPTALMAVGRADVSAINGVFACAIVPASLLIGVQWGLEGVSYAWVMSYAAYFIISVSYALPKLNIGTMNYYGCIAPPLFSALIMYLSVYALRVFLSPFQLPGSMLLALLIGTGAVVYGGVAWLSQRKTFTGAVALVFRH